MWISYSLIFIAVTSICSVDSSEYSSIKDQLNSFERKFQDLEKFLDFMQAQMLIQSETMQSQFKSLTETMETRLKSQSDKMDSLIKSYNGKIEENMKSQSEKLELKIESINESIATQFNSISDKIDLKIKYQNEKIEDQFISLNDSVQAHIESKIGNIGSKTESLIELTQILTSNQTEKIEALFESVELQNNNQNALIHNFSEEFHVLSTKLRDPFQLITLQYKENTLKCDVQMINPTINSTSNVNQSSVSTIEKVVNKQKLNEIRETYNKNKNLHDDDKQIMLSACDSGETSVVSAILDLGFNIDTILDYRTCLRVAADYNRVNLAKLLMDRGADMEIGKTAYNWTPLIAAAANGHLDMVKLLVERGANFSARSTNNKKTALGYAKRNNRQDVTNYLLSKGAPE